jgi:hypothetical protein
MIRPGRTMRTVRVCRKTQANADRNDKEGKTKAQPLTASHNV